MAVSTMGEEGSGRRRGGIVLNLTVLLLFLAAINIGATQTIAHLFAHHPSLGAPLWGQVHAPWK